MKSSVLKFLFRPIQSIYDMAQRVSTLEMVVVELLEEPNCFDANRLGFNGQQQRQAIFLELVKMFQFQAILETGTFFGKTTGFMAYSSKLPIFSCEVKKLFMSVAHRNLSTFSNVSLSHSDSREFLQKMAATDIAKQRCFIYLDAHWLKDLPLKDEISIIVNNYRDFIIMIDDFEVPYDLGYGFDNYGHKKGLDFDTFSNLFSSHNLVSFGPVAASSIETGHKRGCVILGKQGKNSDILTGIKSICMINYQK